MSASTKIFMFGSAGVAAFVAAALFLAPAFRGPSTAARTQNAVTSSVQDKTPAFETKRIVPADVVGTGVTSWAPLTGDGSN
jgi:hypothetical protein